MVKGLHQRRYESVCVGYEGIRLFLRIILAKGHKINIFGIQKKSYVFHIHTQAVIGGNEDQKRLVISQMRLGPIRTGVSVIPFASLAAVLPVHGRIAIISR